MDRVVTDVTVKALQEFDTGDMAEEGGDTDRPASRPPSGRPASTKGSRSGSAAKSSRPTSAAKKASSRPTSAASDRPASRGSGSGRPGSATGSKASGSRQGSVKGSRPSSAQKRPEEEELSITGSRPGSAASGAAAERPSSRKSTERPASGRPQSGRRSSGTASERPGSAASAAGKSGSRPGSARSGSAANRPGLAADRPESAADRPGSAADRSGSAADRPGSAADRPGSAAGRPGSAADRPGSAADRPGSTADRPGSAADRPGSAADRPGSAADRPGSAARRPGSSRHGSAGERPVSSRAGSRRPASAAGADEPQDDGEGEPGEYADQNEAADDASRQPTPPQREDDEPPVGQTQMTDIMARPPGDPDDGDGDSEDDEDDYEEEEEETDEDSDGESEMVVLDPDHPLMQRFQKALKSHLDKQNEKVTLELRELLESLKNKKKDREDLGVDLYGVQQELARHQMMLEKCHDDFAGLNDNRKKTEEELTDVRSQYRNKQLSVNTEKKKGSELQSEVENLALRIQFVDTAKEDVRSDIAIMRRAAEKAEQEASVAEVSKQKQDLFVDRLVEKVDKLREEIAMYEAQLTAQGEETKAAKESLTEAHMEMESIGLEKKQLFQQWNSSLIGMRRRDEAHAAMLEALNQQQQRILSLETEIDGYKKSVQKEQEQNEKLTLVLNKTEVDISTVKKLLAQCQARHTALKNEYATYTRMLHETEQALNRANTDKTLRQNEVNALRKQIEREFLEKVRLEDEIVEKLRTELTLDKASKYTNKLTGKLRGRTKEMEAQIAQGENDISKETLQVSNTLMRIERLHKIMEDLDEEIQQKNEIISRSEVEITRRNAIIERKQGALDQYNKKLEQMISQAGGVELGPLEIQINSLQKSIQAEQEQIGELQQMWLRDQSELVRLTKDKDTQSRDVQVLKKQLTILMQKKIRTENEINQQNIETGDIQRSISNMQNDMLKLNMLLHKERGMEYDLQQGNVLMESDFIGGLRQAERESIEMQADLDGLKEEKERLLNSLVEAERQIMLWEKKTQLARETRHAVDSEVGQGEIRAMKAEIHRMQVRYTQLMKQQERMIQEMEKAVSRRDTIVTRGDAQSKINTKVLTKGTFQRQMGELKKKIKSTIQDAHTCDSEIRELRENQQELSSQLEERQLNVQQLQSSSDTLDGDIDRLFEQKHKNLSDLLARQQKSKYYQQLKDGRYTRLCKTESTLDTELEKQGERMQTLTAITDRLNQEYPHVQPALKKVTLAFGSRNMPVDGNFY